MLFLDRGSNPLDSTNFELYESVMVRFCNRGHGLMNFLLYNKLHKSVITNKLKINITTEEYEKIKILIESLKNKYENELEFIKNNKKNFDKIKAHNLLVKSIIKEVIESFEILKKYNVCIFLTGSFARYTNKLNSDLDLHFSYNNQYKNILFKYEEIIYYVLFSIFDLDRGKVHNMILSRINNPITTKINNKIDNDDLEILLICDTNQIKYKITGNIKNRIYLQYGNRKDIRTIYKYLKKEILSFNREWAHVFYIFTNEKKFLKYYNKLLKLEKKNLNDEKIENRLVRLKNQIEYIDRIIVEANSESINDFKKIFQMEEFKLLYEYVSYKRDLCLLNNIDWKFINLEDNKNYLVNVSSFYNIEKYLYSLFEVVEPLKTKYSIHKEGDIDSLNFKLLEKELYSVNEILRGELWKD